MGEMAALHNETSAGLAPHLRIAHLLWWTAASAMGFAAYDGITPKRFLRDRADFFVVYDSVMGLVLGTILTGAGIMAYRRWCGGMPYPFLPGQWLLILGLAGDLANGVAIGAFDFLIRLYDPLEAGSGYGLPSPLYPIQHIARAVLDWRLPSGYRLGDRRGCGPGTHVAFTPSALTALALGLSGIRPRRCDPLRGARPLPDPGPLLRIAEADRLLVPPFRPHLRDVRFARDVRDARCSCLGCPEPRGSMGFTGPASRPGSSSPPYSTPPTGLLSNFVRLSPLPSFDRFG